MKKCNRAAISIIFFILVFCFFFLFYSTRLEYNNAPQVLIFVVKGFLIIINGVAASALFYKFVIQKPKMKEGYKSISLFIYVVFILSICLEGIFMFVTQSHSVGYSLAGKKWNRFYWKPINQYNYRDRDYNLEDIKEKKKIVVLGDSFSAGHGIKNIEDRFSNQLEKKLPSEYIVLNLARNGNDSISELSQFKSFGVRPDFMILQYFVNDIEGRAIRLRKRFNLRGFEPYKDLNPLGQALVRNSYFLNYVYWKFPRTDTQNYADTLDEAYHDPETLVLHLVDLSKFAKLARKNRIPLVVVLFPFLNNVEKSAVYLQKVEKLFLTFNVPVVNVTDLITDIPLKRRVANSNDFHASEIVHKLVAEKLYDILDEKYDITKNKSRIDTARNNSS